MFYFFFFHTLFDQFFFPLCVNTGFYRMYTKAIVRALFDKKIAFFVLFNGPLFYEVRNFELKVMKLSLISFQPVAVV